MSERATTDDEYERFKAAFVKWQEQFGLTDYKVAFRREKLDNAYADIEISPKQRFATVRFASENDDKSDPVDPERHGLHEALHLLLARMRWLGECRWLDSAEIEEEDEAVVRRLERVLMSDQ